MTYAATAKKAGAALAAEPPLRIKPGDMITDRIASIKQPDEKHLSTEDLFKGKVVLIGVPGAFTRTCSEKHLPAFVQQADAIRRKGVDRIICITPDNTLVAKAWGEKLGAGDTIQFIGDGNGDLFRALGLNLDLSHRGMGQRSERFVLVAENGKVTHLGVEKAIGTVEASSAESILSKL